MARLFISHASANNAAAHALNAWLEVQGFDDVFLDIDASGGLIAGERWQEALKAAADRCEAVLFLLSPAWLASRWCLAEFLLAKTLHKRIFGLIIEPVAIGELPPEMTAEWQLCDLVGEACGRFREAGLGMLRQGLAKAGLEARSFPWPPPDDPDRAPYRGLRALDPQDAAVFFGRDVEIIRGMDRIRGLAEAELAAFLVVLGASGSGKSSFLRAGLWPRLARDDSNFLPLPVIRPEAAVLSGEAGLAVSVAAAFGRLGGRCNRGDVRHALLTQPDSFPTMLAQLSALARGRLNVSGAGQADPMPVLAVDQAEELFVPEGAAEANRFLEVMAPLLAARKILLLATIRSDRFEQLQAAKALVGIRRELFDLPPMPPGEYKTVIEGPAQRASAAGHKLAIAPALTARLMAETQGAEALPLLGFTLERMFRDFGSCGTLTVEQYDALGGINGVIAAAVAAALAAPRNEPAIPAAHDVQMAVLRAAFIPWLSGIDPESRTPRRRVAAFADLTEAARPMVARLVAARLLVADHRAGHDVVEVAHESLLRNWPILRGWLDEDAADLAVLDGVDRAVSDWTRHDRAESWLAHRGGRLAEAERVLARPDFAQHPTPAGRLYLAACHAREAAVLAERQAASSRLLRRTQLGLAVATVLMLLSGGLGWLAMVSAHSTAEALSVARANHVLLVAREALNRKDSRIDEAFALLGSAAAEQTGEKLPEFVAAATALSYQPSAITRFVGHAKPVLAAVFSPGGTRVVTASADTTARLWDSRTGLLRATLEGHTDWVVSAAFSPDGTRLATASVDKTARLWDSRSGQFLATLSGHTGTVRCVAFSPDGDRVLTASDDQTARLWNAHTGAPLGILSGHTSWVGSAAFSPDGTRIVTASGDQTARLWDSNSGKMIAILRGHTDEVASAAFSPDGTRLVTASFDHTARLWDGQTGQPMATLEGHTGKVRRAVFTPDGARIVTASNDHTARLWDARTGHPLAVMQGHADSVLSAGLSADGTRLVTASADGTAGLWDAATGQALATLQGHTGPVQAASFSPDGQRVLTASDDHTARLWDAHADRLLAVLTRHGQAMSAVAFSTDGKRLLTVSAENDAQVWDAQAARPLATLQGHEGLVASAVFSPDGNRVLTTSIDHTARLWDAATGQSLLTLRGHLAAVMFGAFSPDGGRVVTASIDHTARLWDARTGEALAILAGHTDAVRFAAFSPDGSRVLTASDDETARLWNAHTGAALLMLRGHTGRVRAAVFSPDGSRVLTVSRDHTARLWDARTGAALASLRGHAKFVLSGRFSPDGKLIVTASDDFTARLWDARTGQAAAILQGHTDAVNAAVFSPDGARVLTASDDHTARLWDARTGLALLTLRGHTGQVTAAVFSPDGARVTTASSDGTARLWDVAAVAEGSLSPWLQMSALPVLPEADRRALFVRADRSVMQGDADAEQHRAEMMEDGPRDFPAALTAWTRAERLFEETGRLSERDYAAAQRANLAHILSLPIAVGAWTAAQPVEKRYWYQDLFASYYQ